MNGGRETRTVLYLVQGAVQGVGFRPFVYRVASDLGLSGWVCNDPRGVLIEAGGAADCLKRFEVALRHSAPPAARVSGLSVLETSDGSTEGAFRILDSRASGTRSAAIMADLATCQECLREILDPGNRRHLYPFTNCTHCGPRFSIVERIPYDRPNTTMRDFTMCADCRREYEDPDDRRFHAQPNACPECGPRVELWDPQGRSLADRAAAVEATAELIRRGGIVAVKGLGGFHLVADARNGAAIEDLRRRKRREEKPLAIMAPSLAHIRLLCSVSDEEAALLASPSAPLVLLRRRQSPGEIPDAVAPGNPFLGVMLPYTPLHHILLRRLDFPVVATSGNLTDEPICTDEREALDRLRGIADAFLVHDRRIARPVDDSVARIVLGRPLLIRRSRGYAPLPVALQGDALPSPTLAVGAHLKSTVALGMANDVFISQHIGDLETRQAHAAFEAAVTALQGLYEQPPATIVCDLHPDYASTRFAHRLGIRVIAVQHHHAHIVSCMAENGLEGEVFGVSWDGTGYGTDGTIWGGEFLRATRSSFERLAHLRAFRLPGGERGVREPRRSALSILFEILGEEAFACVDLPPVRAFAAGEIRIVADLLRKQLHAPLTSSAGRLFDAIASLAGIRQVSSFEGQAAMELEFAADGAPAVDPYPFGLTHGDMLVVDWAPMIVELLAEIRAGRAAAHLSARFHRTMAQVVADVARESGLRRVILSGGCFQNALLLETSVSLLREAGREVFWHRQVPPNDGGISLGQIAFAAASRQNTVQGSTP
jgi:hydrogenase maturation protein HypF